MILTIISWGWIGAASFICGFTLLHQTLGKRKNIFWGPDFYMVCGLAALTVYAQAFSLFAGVGAWAAIVLALACLAGWWVCRKDMARYWKELLPRIKRIRVLLPACITAVILLLITVHAPIHYDTDLYHAQSIRWIEEYGVVKGLGNLHNRLAYNSSFFCLQALFSLKFLVSQSLHTMNGFVALVMVNYAVITLGIFQRRRIGVSCLLKLGLVLYFTSQETLYTISSPNSDILALSMVLYLSAKWAEYMEQESKVSAQELGVLCLLAVWTATVKLSSALLVLFTVYPAVMLIKERKWKTIGCFLAVGLLTASPFLIRNVIVSGYLLYPYETIDIFDVDWKMSSSVVADDSREIMAWGRNMRQRENYEAPFSRWFPVWYSSLSQGYKMLFLLNVFCLPAAAVFIVWNMCKKKDVMSACLFGVSGLSMLMWFFTSPLIRYGGVFMLLLPLEFVGVLLLRMRGRTLGIMITTVVLGWGITAGGLYADRLGAPPLKRQADYRWREAGAVEWDGETFYIPTNSDQLGYQYFPGTPNLGRLEKTELRSGSLRDGFRLKEEFRDAVINTDGAVAD